MLKRNLLYFCNIKTDLIRQECEVVYFVMTLYIGEEYSLFAITFRLTRSDDAVSLQ